MKKICAFLLLVLAGCVPGVQPTMVEKTLLDVNQDAWELGQMAVCHTVRVGTLIQELGNDPKRFAGWKAFCKQPAIPDLVGEVQE